MMKRATAAVIKYENKILIAYRSKDDFWEFPGGRIDAGETPAECVVREIKEELAIDIRVEKPLGVIEGTYRRMTMQVYAFLASWTGGTIIRHVHRDVKWVDLKELSQYPLVEEDKVIFEKFLMYQTA